MDVPLKLIHTVTPDTTKLSLSVSRPLRRYELDSRQLKTVADKKFELWTRSEQSSNSHWHTIHDKDRIVLLCLPGDVNWALPLLMAPTYHVP